MCEGSESSVCLLWGDRDARARLLLLQLLYPASCDRGGETALPAPHIMAELPRRGTQPGIPSAAVPSPTDDNVL